MRFFTRLFAVPAAVGAALMYFFDPEQGKRRRSMARDRTAGFFRQSGRRAERAGRGVAAGAQGLKEKATHLKEEEKPQPDDVTLARKVETEIFRPADAPKGQVSVNVEQGVVFLRGEVERPEIIKDLEARARKVQGVRDVENLLHVPETPAPTGSPPGT
jgi:osmotically-inducible protein OsmY